MPWSLDIPPAPQKPAIAGWFAVLNILGAQTFTLNTAATVLGLIAALQPVPITNAGIIGLYLQGNQLVSVNNSAVNRGVQSGAQSFAVTNSALLRPSVIASQPLSITQLATVIGGTTAAQAVSVINAGIVTGTEMSTLVNQQVVITNSAINKGKPSAAQSFTVTNSSLFRAKPGAAQSFTIATTAVNKGVQVANQSAAITNAAVIFAKLNAAQSFSVTNSVSLYGKPGAAQSFGINTSAAATEVSNPIEFDSISAPADATGNQSWACPASAGSTVIVDVVNLGGTVNSCTYDGVAMTKLVDMFCGNNSSAARHVRYVKTNVSGPATIAVNKGGFNWVSSYAVSYKNVGSIGATNTTFGTAANALHGPLSSSGMLHQCFVFGNGGLATPVVSSITGGVNRRNHRGGVGTPAVCASDSEGSTTFSVSSSAFAWSSIATDMIPI